MAHVAFPVAHNRRAEAISTMRWRGVKVERPIAPISGFFAEGIIDLKLTTAGR
jgi:hypothetical protein